MRPARARVATMNLIDALLGEHGVLCALFEHLEKTLSPRMDPGEVREAAHLLHCVLVPHVRLEEELLFQTLERLMGGMPPLVGMRGEHAEIETILSAALNEDVPAAAEDLRGIIRFARTHFAKEEQFLFPLSRTTIPIEELEQLGARWAEARGVRVG